MNCLEITQIPVVQKAIKDTTNKNQLERIFNCIYKLFHADFINWIIAKYSITGLSRNELQEMAEDAFQDGLYVFFKKTKEAGLKEKATLRTIVFTFGMWQFMARKKKEATEQSCTVSIEALGNTIEIEDSGAFTITELLSNGEPYWDEALQLLLSEKEHQLYQAIRLLPRDKWQKAIMWSYFDGMETAEIAERMGVTKEDVYNKLSNAKKSLRNILITKFNFLNG